MSRPYKPLSFIPPLLSDQTLYSWTTMYHVLSGNISPDETRRQLFGSEKAGRHFHIPSHLTAFCSRTQLALGDAEGVAALATVLPFFTRFRPRTVHSDALKMVSSDNAAGLSQMLNMGNMGPFCSLPARACPDCLREDKRKLNFVYWRRAHQLPGVFVCQIHGAPLYLLQLSETKHSLSEFILPSEGHCQRRRFDSHQTSTLRRLADLARDIANTTFDGARNRDALRATCSLQIAERLKKSAGLNQLGPLDLAKDFNHHFKAVEDIPELGTILHQRGIRALLSLLDHSESHAHPLEWMLLIDWLFGDWESFERCFSESRSSAARPPHRNKV